jgi:hypothetical protein
MAWPGSKATIGIPYAFVTAFIDEVASGEPVDAVGFVDYDQEAYEKGVAKKLGVSQETDKKIGVATQKATAAATREGIKGVLDDSGEALKKELDPLNKKYDQLDQEIKTREKHIRKRKRRMKKLRKARTKNLNKLVPKANKILNRGIIKWAIVGYDISVAGLKYVEDIAAKEFFEKEKPKNK